MYMWEGDGKNAPSCLKCSPPPPQNIDTLTFFICIINIFFIIHFFYTYSITIPQTLSLVPFTFVQGWSYMLGWAKFLKISFYYIVIFNILIISPQKWDSHPPPTKIELVQQCSLKKLSNWSSSYSKRIVSQVYFLL